MSDEERELADAVATVRSVLDSPHLERFDELAVASELMRRCRDCGATGYLDEERCVDCGASYE